jgi:hypothetical protein
MSEEPRYLAALRRTLAGLQLPPGYHDVKVLHDSWCRIFQGGVCTCNPEVRFKEAGGGGLSAER